MSKRIIFKDNIVQYANRYNLTDLGGGTYEITTNSGTVTQSGTPLSAANLNALADEVIFKLKDTSTSTTTYTASLDNIASYFEGLTILFKPASTNTGASTININSVGAVAVKKVNNSGNKADLVLNDMIKNKYSTMTFDGTDFIMNNPSADLAQVITDIQDLETRLDTDETLLNTIKNEGVKFAVATGSSNAYGVSITNTTVYYSGLNINVVINVDNTGSCTLNANSLGTKAIKFNGVDLVAGDLKANKLYQVVYNGVYFELQVDANRINNLQGTVMSHLADNTKQIPHLGTTTNSGDAYSITTTEVINANEKFTIKFNVASTTAPTLKINTGNAYAIKKANGNNAKLYASVYTVFWDGSNFILLGEGGEYGTATKDEVLTGYTFGTENGLQTGTATIASLGGKNYATSTVTVTGTVSFAITGLSFKPSTVILRTLAGASSPCTIIYSSKGNVRWNNSIIYSGWTDTSFDAGANGSAFSVTLRKSSSNIITPNNDGFTVNSPFNLQGFVFEWEIFG